MFNKFRSWLRGASFLSKAAQWVVAFLLAFIIAASFTMFTLFIVSQRYISEHPIPQGQEDLGYGLTIISILAACLIVSIPLIAVLTYFFRKILRKIISKSSPSFKLNASERAN